MTMIIAVMAAAILGFDALFLLALHLISKRID